MEAKVYNQEGKEAGQISLPEALFALPWNGDLVHQVVVSMQSNERQTVADTKGRGEVSGGGKKPWKQKGTGRARHGSIRSPIWKGGGVTHGPTSERNFKKKVNRTMKTKALFTVLSQKLRDNEIIFLDDLKLAAAKTKAAASVLASLARVKGFESLGYKKGNRALVTLPGRDAAAEKSLRNLPTVLVTEARNLNPLELLNYKFVVLTKPAEALKVFTARAK